MSTNLSAATAGLDEQILADTKFEASLEAALEVIRDAENIAIAGHVNPDGDAVGSAFGLRDLLRALGKNVTVLLGQTTPAPDLYSFLPDYDYTFMHDYTDVPDLFIAVDVPTAKRLGTAEELIERAATTLVIDHHRNYEGFAKHYVGDPSAPATASLVWKLIKASGVEPTTNMAMYCYTGVMTDTGRFAYRNTNQTTFSDAAEMVGLGVSPSYLCEQIYENRSIESIRLEGIVLSRIGFICDGAIVYSYLYETEMAELGVGKDAIEELPSLLRSIKGVEVSVLFREEKDLSVRTSLRSRSLFDVGAFAMEFGGGGHAGAAGCTLEMNLEEAISELIDKLSKEYSSQNNG